MKKLFLAVVVFCGVALSAQAQDFKPLRVDGGVGYGLPFSSVDVPTGGSKSLYNGGVLFYVEPKYEVIPQVAVGLRWEGAIFAGGSAFDDIQGASISVSLTSAYLLTGDYYFNNNTFRPFAGVGLGAYSIGGISVSGISGDAGSKTNFGFLVRAGFDVSHFRLTVSYNFAGTAPKIGVVEPPVLHYLAATVGFYIGGGKN